jgi:hypothetical protein
MAARKGTAGDLEIQQDRSQKLHHMKTNENYK